MQPTMGEETVLLVEFPRAALDELGIGRNAAGRG
jgi:hypothetical protein